MTDWPSLLLARAAAERAEADRAAECVDPIREAMHRHCARVLEELARAEGREKRSDYASQENT